LGLGLWRAALTNRKALLWEIHTSNSEVAMNNFNAGEVVCLKSGGPDMTVERVEVTAGNVSVICVWFVEQNLYRASFPISALSLALWPVAA
jgi:uncharacterized protein YodC (DUF2158 family)